MKKTAQISKCNKYRYYLTREWDENLPFVNFIGLNPSTADGYEDDATIRKCISYAKQWRYGGIIMTNLFAFRTRHPHEMRLQKEIAIGDENNEYLIKGKRESKISVAAWGNHGFFNDRWKEVADLLPDLYCLKMTKQNQPSHPLYLSSELKPINFVCRSE